MTQLNNETSFLFAESQKAEINKSSSLKDYDVSKKNQINLNQDDNNCMYLNKSPSEEKSEYLFHEEKPKIVKEEDFVQHKPQLETVQIQKS